MTRLYHPDDLFAGKMLTLDSKQTHYLRHVLRARPGHQINNRRLKPSVWN